MARHRAGSFVASGMVLAVAGGFAVYAARAHSSDVGAVRRYAASFASSSGLAPGDAVSVAGITVGRVDAIALDRRHFTARVAFSVDERLAVHPDASVSVGSAMGGGGSLALDPGREAGLLPAGRTITRAQPATSLEQQVGDYIFGAGGLSSD